MGEKSYKSFGYSLIFISLSFALLFYLSWKSIIMLNPDLEKEGRSKYLDFNLFFNNSIPLIEGEYLIRKRTHKKVIVMLADSLRYDCNIYIYIIYSCRRNKE